MTGVAKSPTTVSVAPITPLQAAKMTHINMVPTAKPPGKRCVQRCIASKSFSAVPDFSNIAPMNTKRGTAAKIDAPVMSSILCRKTKKRFSPKRNMPNKNAVDISANAIGTPRKISVSKTGNIHVTMSVI